MGKIQERLISLHKSIIKQQKEVGFLSDLACKLPDLDYKTIYVGPHRADLWLSVEVKTLEDIKPLLERFAPISIGRYADSCTSFCPYEALSKQELYRLDNDTAEFQTVMPVYLEADHVEATYSKYCNLKACWFSQLAETRIQFEAAIEYNSNLVSWYWQNVDMGNGKFMKVDMFRFAWKDATTSKFSGTGFCPRKIWWPSAFTTEDLFKYEPLAI